MSRLALVRHSSQRLELAKLKEAQNQLLLRIERLEAVRDQKNP